MSTVKASDVIVEALEQEFEDIFRQHHDMVFRTAFGVLGNPGDAEDVVQNIFLRLLDRGISPDLTRNPAGYLYRTAVNESLNLIRSKKRLVLISDAEHIEAQTAPEPSESAEEIHKRLYEAVAKLSPSSAHILVLRYVHKHSDAEIAKLLGTSRGTIAVTLYRARARLRKWIRASLERDKS
jgi:RNA polymerase sigma-70 factor (ECF subfamily)